MMLKTFNQSQKTKGTEALSTSFKNITKRESCHYGDGMMDGDCSASMELLTAYKTIIYTSVYIYSLPPPRQHVTQDQFSR